MLFSSINPATPKQSLDSIMTLIIDLKFSSLTISQCDETKPSCLKCVAGELRCPYLDEPSLPQTPASLPSPSPPIYAPTPSSSSNAESTIESFASLSAHGPFHGLLNMAHLELFHHISTTPFVFAIYELHDDASYGIMQATVQCALQAPYLMHELLSFAALHFALLYPSNAESWRHQSTELQTYALSLFNNKNPDEQESFIPSFLFASMLGTHLLHEAVTSTALDFGPFLDRFVGYLSLSRGVRMQLTGTNWASLSNTPFHPLITIGDRIPNADTAHAPELVDLENLLKAADMSSSSLSTYLGVLNNLKAAYQAQSLFNTNKDSGSRATARSAIFAWPILASPEYTDLLTQRRPEALAILAHYGVLLHWHREIWIFGDGGRRLVEGVEQYLGGYWEKWLELPRSVMMET